MWAGIDFRFPAIPIFAGIFLFKSDCLRRVDAASARYADWLRYSSIFSSKPQWHTFSLIHLLATPQRHSLFYAMSSLYIPKMKYSRTSPHRSRWDWRFFTFISGLPLKRGKITLNTIIWDLKRLTFIDGEPLKTRLLLRGSTVVSSCTRFSPVWWFNILLLVLIKWSSKHVTIPQLLTSNCIPSPLITDFSADVIQTRVRLGNYEKAQARQLLFFSRALFAH